jgi:hypothetical protein
MDTVKLLLRCASCENATIENFDTHIWQIWCDAGMDVIKHCGEYAEAKE